MKNEKNRSVKKNNSSKLFHHKSAQIQLTFNWFYVLIAGAVILLFFVGIVVKQKAAAEDNLASEVVRIMESIFTGASVSEKTKNFIDTSGLADYTLYFDCEEGVSEFGIKGKGTPSQDRVSPIFVPYEIKTTQLILWSLPYKLPFKVIDFMFVTSQNTKYFLLGNGAGFATEFINSTEGFNRVEINNLNQIDPGKNFQIRIIDFDGTLDENSPVPEKLKLMDDDKVTMLSFLGTSQVNYYQMLDHNSWKKINSEPVQIVSLGGERDAAKYAAIFSGDDKIYRCNMGKAFQRLQYLIEVYEGKLIDIELYYNENIELSLSKECMNYIQAGDYDPNIETELSSLKGNLGACLLDYPETYSSCISLMGVAANLKKADKDLGEKGDCLTLY
jgi:hypothetical protein